MITLSATTQSLMMNLDGVVTANQLDITATYVDIIAAGVSGTGVCVLTASNSASYVTIVPVPDGSTTRKLSHLTIFNSDTIAATVNIYIDNNGTKKDVFKATLLPNEVVEYTDANGFKVIDVNGAQKTSVDRTGRLNQLVIKTSGVTYTPGTGTTSIVAKLIGAGGGGGGAQFSTNGAVGAGGGSGAYAEKKFFVVAGTAYTIAIGTGGTAGANTGGTGGTGGDTTLAVGGVTVTAKGGLGGVGMAASAAAKCALGGIGVIATNGDINGIGATGQAGVLVVGGASPVGSSGAGGDTILGGGGGGRVTNGTGIAATANQGGGGGGAAAISSSGVGGVGGSGIIIIEEYF
jgi:hypothetical protein